MVCGCASLASRQAGDGRPAVLARIEDAVHAEAPTQSHELGQFGSPSPGDQAVSL
jgi:hypothetical protein